MDLKELLKSAWAGDSLAQEKIADWPDESEGELLQALKELALEGYPNGIVAWGEYVLGSDSEGEDVQLAVEMLKKAVEEGNDDAAYALGKYYYARDEIESGSRYLNIASECGNLNARLMLLEHSPLMKNVKVKYHWDKLEKAHFENYELALNLGYLYDVYYGSDNRKEFAKGFFEEAGINYDPEFDADDLFAAGYEYIIGEKVNRDLDYAWKTLELAAEKGSEDAALAIKDGRDVLEKFVADLDMGLLNSPVRRGLPNINVQEKSSGCFGIIALALVLFVVWFF